MVKKIVEHLVKKMMVGMIKKLYTKLYTELYTLNIFCRKIKVFVESVQFFAKVYRKVDNFFYNCTLVSN